MGYPGVNCTSSVQGILSSSAVRSSWVVRSERDKDYVTHLPRGNSPILSLCVCVCVRPQFSLFLSVLLFRPPPLTPTSLHPLPPLSPHHLFLWGR